MKNKNTIEHEKEKFVAPGAEFYKSLDWYVGLDDFYKSLFKKKDKTDFDKFNIFLMKLGGADRIAYRRKILLLRRYLKTIGCDWTGL